MCRGYARAKDVCFEAVVLVFRIVTIHAAIGLLHLLSGTRILGDVAIPDTRKVRCLRAICWSQSSNNAVEGVKGKTYSLAHTDRAYLVSNK